MKLLCIRKRNSKMTHYKFEGDITIYTVRKLKKFLTGELQQTSKLEFDLHNVDKFDSAGFQLFVYFEREAGIKGKQIQIVSKSNHVSKIFNLFGVGI